MGESFQPDLEGGPRGGPPSLTDQGWWVKWGHHGHTFTQTYTRTHTTYCKCTQQQKKTLVRGSYCAPLWQYYVWARTLICLLWRRVHFSAIFSPLELELKQSPPPSQSFPPPTHCLCLLPIWGPSRPHALSLRGWGWDGGVQCCMQAFRVASGWWSYRVVPFAHSLLS